MQIQVQKTTYNAQKVLFIYELGEKLDWKTSGDIYDQVSHLGISMEENMLVPTLYCVDPSSPSTHK
jgi:hypothetical protein